jgi:restriction endonuclease S subunit
MSKLTVGDVQKSFTDYVALVKKTCKTEKDIQDLKRENDSKIQKIMVNNQALIAENEKLIDENEKLNKQLNAIKESRFSKTNTKKNTDTKKEVEMTIRPPWNSSTKPGGGRTRRRKNIKKYRTQKHRLRERTKQ